MPEKNKEEPGISVIIPALNEGEVIGKVIKQIRDVVDQVDRNHEIIVIDDGSQDDTAQNAMAAGAIVIRHPYNIGNGAAVKSGFLLF